MTVTSKAPTLAPVEVTVTRLEMQTPPVYRQPLPIGQNVALLRAEKMPRHFYRYLMDRVGREWTWVNALRIPDAQLDELLAQPDRNITTLYLDGAPGGFFEICQEGDKQSLHFFGLMPHATGRGLGRWFLGAAIEAAWASKPRAVTVETCTLDHPAALQLYQKLGFEPVSQRRETILPMTQVERALVVTGL